MYLLPTQMISIVAMASQLTLSVVSLSGKTSRFSSPRLLQGIWSYDQEDTHRSLLASRILIVTDYSNPIQPIFELCLSLWPEDLVAPLNFLQKLCALIPRLLKESSNDNQGLVNGDELTLSGI